MLKDACTPVCLCVPSAQCVFDSCEEVSSVIGVSISTLFLHCESMCKEVLKRKNCSCISLCRYKRGSVSKKLCGLLVKPSSLRLQGGVKCGRKIHGRLVVSFTVQKSFVKCIRVSELHLTACSLTDALLTSSPPCASVKISNLKRCFPCSPHSSLPTVLALYS